MKYRDLPRSNVKTNIHAGKVTTVECRLPQNIEIIIVPVNRK